MSPPLDDYILKMRNLHQRYGLSENVLELFRAYGEHHRGTAPPEALGRRLRTSNLTRACTDTITSLAAAMQKNPTPECIAECSEIINCCSEMLNLANESKQGATLPFMKFPAEIRRIVYRHYFRDLLPNSRWGQSSIIIRKRPHSCICVSHESHAMNSARPLNLSLILTCSHIKDEALEEWFKLKHNVFSFACGCELRHCLQINKSMSYNLRSVEVHWTGEKSDSAFELLKKVPTLKNLVVIVSKSTTNTMSRKEALLRKYLPQRSQTRITEALGFEELVDLMAMGTVDNVSVSNVDRSQAYRRPEQERNGLEKYLWHVLKEAAH